MPLHKPHHRIHQECHGKSNKERAQNQKYRVEEGSQRTEFRDYKVKCNRGEQDQEKLLIPVIKVQPALARWRIRIVFIMIHGVLHAFSRFLGVF